MPRRFLTHFSTVALVHAVLLFGGLTLLRNEEVSRSIGQRILNLKLAGEVLLQQKVVSRPVKTTSAPSVPKTSTAEVKPGEIPETVAPALSGTAIASIRDIYKSELRARIEENKYYPAVARRMGHKGTVIVAFTLLSDGTIINARIDSSSGNARLDGAGLDAVKKVGKFKAIPSELGEKTMDVSVPLRFH